MGRAGLGRLVVCFSVAMVLLAVQPSAADPVTKTVSGLANIFGAGYNDAPDPDGGGGGIAPPYVDLSAGSTVTFSSVIGTVSCCGGGSPNGADGGTGASGTTDIYSWRAISGIKDDSATMFLVGVFTNASPSGSAPARLDFTGAAAKNFTDLSPLLNQTFFIGDGRRNDGTTLQKFHAPAGATRLSLGFADAYDFGTPQHLLPGYYGDNRDSLSATLAVTAPVPLPPSLLLLAPGVAGVAVARRRRKG